VGPLSFATFLVLALSASGAGRAEGELAPDGHRGFGPDPDNQAVHKLFRNPSRADEAFMRGLQSLSRNVDVLEHLTRAGYVKRGYDSFFEPLERPEFETLALYEIFAQHAESPLANGPLEHVQALALARMALDPRFHARHEVHRDIDLDRSELQGALDVLEASVRGNANVQAGSDLKRLTRIADLNAAMLRARYFDFEALKAPVKPAPDDSAVVRLAQALESGAPATLELWQKSLAATRRFAARMAQDLFIVRLREQLKDELEERATNKLEARAILDEVRLIAPYTQAGKGASEEILRMSKMDRYRLCISRGQAGIELDPLLAELHDIVAEGLYYSGGALLAKAHFDRFLVLRGIRYYDLRTYAERQLDVREVRALEVLSIPAGSGAR
jgi:hypothetical protein